MSDVSPGSLAWLVPLAGPTLPPLRLVGGQPVILGRHQDATVRLPPDAETVSRFHARLTCDGGKWRIADLNSRWGTFVNGCRLAPQTDVPLGEGDLVRITPWTFSFSATESARRGTESFNDLVQLQTLVRSVPQDQLAPLADDMLAMLLEAAAGIHAVETEAQLAQVLLDEARRGTGLPNAALLRPVDSEGRIEVIAAKPQSHAESGAVYSRSLIAVAAKGAVAELSGQVPAGVSESIVRMQITAALCVPILLAQSVAAYLYLDSRGTEAAAARRLRPNAAAFCLALARIAGLALANIKRADMEKRAAAMEAELAAAAQAQQLIMPRGSNRVGPFDCSGQSRPGRYLAGDFFNVIPLSQTRVAVALGDVSGKGVVASVLMTASQGFLHAAMAQHGDVALAMRQLNAYVSPRVPPDKFITLWVGVFDSEARTLTYVDAGHGYALMLDAEGAARTLAEGAGLPVGISSEAEYEAHSIALPPTGRVVVVSDGFIEQPAGNAPDRRQFDMAGVQTALAKGGDEIPALFEALATHAGGTAFADDVTAVVVKW